MKTKPTFSRDM